MNELSLFKKIVKAEGYSYLFLLFLAMPLKYFFQLPEAVKYTGWIHGFLFIVYIVLLLYIYFVHKWTFVKTIIAVLVSLIPFATFWLYNQLEKDKDWGKNKKD